MSNGTNLYAVFVEALRSSFDRRGVERVLETLDSAVSGSAALIEEVSRDNSDYADAVTDDLCDHVEDLLGVGFIVSQVAIKSVMAAARRLDKYHFRISGNHLIATNLQTVMKHGLPAIAGQHSAIEVMDAAANYFKHRDEWVGAWDKLTRTQASTTSVVTSAGAAMGSSGNLRTLARVLGNTRYSRMVDYCDGIDQWVEALYVSHHDELIQRGHIQRPR